jgi:DNA modification methylase
MPSLNFKGKTLVQNFHLLVPYHELKPVKSKSLTDKVSLHDNLVVHGDNLKALKSLLPYYHGKVKCIYADPPYNTGNIKKEGWRYSDNVSSPMHQEWLGKIVSREDLTRHDKWLCMMWPRLRVMREFLADDGIILVSIDDNEAHHLRDAMDEIFGEENFVAQLVWEKGRKNDAQLFSSGHEYMLVYAHSLARLRELKTVWRESRLVQRNSGINISNYARNTARRTKLSRLSFRIGSRTCQRSTRPRPSVDLSMLIGLGLGATGISRGRGAVGHDTTWFIRIPANRAKCPNAAGFTRRSRR